MGTPFLSSPSQGKLIPQIKKRNSRAPDAWQKLAGVRKNPGISWIYLPLQVISQTTDSKRSSKRSFDRRRHVPHTRRWLKRASAEHLPSHNLEAIRLPTERALQKEGTELTLPSIGKHSK
ncbi:hypothetical protein CEXT_140001 [Caerostris extrusa]|uniref:Uncharacterized protein n=1 Tax=Caerostris extrusa TaxID=172846 RepID=A0AAV4TN80_CAEEX|nr:hypothetical protein CEXT_140001 [Caerostris extrusa]